MNARNYRFHRVVIIESLEDFEVKTGKENGNILSWELQQLKKPTPVEYYPCESVSEFKKMICDLIEQTSSERVPLLHIECHGDIVDGLVFANGTFISWGDLGELIFPLHIASGCNLMLCLSACHAAHFLSQMGNFKIPCPCRILVAPIGEVDPADCMRGFRVFYSKLFETMSVDAALEMVETFNPRGAKWLGEHAEKWFYNIATHHIQENYSEANLKKKALAIQGQLKALGKFKSIGEVKSDLKEYMRYQGLRTIYEKFFGIDVAPEVDDLFSYVFEDFCDWVQGMREAGHIAF